MKANESNILSGAREKRDRAFNGIGVSLWNFRFEAFRRDAVNGSREGFVIVIMTSDPRIKPVGDVDCSIGSNHHVGGAEKVTSLAFDKVETFEGVRCPL